MFKKHSLVILPWGAYQEILGGMHNLFGDTHTIVVTFNESGEADISEINEGDTVEDMLNYVHLDVADFRQTYEELVSAKLPADQRESILKELHAGLSGYTYLEDL